MAEDSWYDVSDEDEEDALLNRAYDRRNSWEGLPPPAALSFNSPCNPLVDDAAGVTWWSGRNSTRNCVN